jgi:hypothetical protein
MVTMRKFEIGPLVSGGLITNYECPSRCRHCLYRCSPRWPKLYIDEQTTAEAVTLMRRKGCRVIHIGGGEPFLKPHKLAAILDIIRQVGVDVDYVETNCAWFKDDDSAVDMLTKLKKSGLKSLLVSISPFHNETIPFSKTSGVIAACRQAGVAVFPWSADFVNDLSAFDPRRPHAFEEYESKFGSRYLASVLKRYWIHMGGRALDLFRPVVPLHPADHILDTNRGSCAIELTDTRHFHIDLFGNYIPGLCAGLAIRYLDLEQALAPNRYPLLVRLFQNGIRGLADDAQARGFQPQKSGYINKCDLCTEIRSFLYEQGDGDSDELKPDGFYQYRHA